MTVQNVRQEYGPSNVLADLLCLQGRVACEMGSNELIVTELVFNNQLTERPPEEIAALLSCLVFQQRNCSDPELTTSLKQVT